MKEEAAIVGNPNMALRQCDRPIKDRASQFRGLQLTPTTTACMVDEGCLACVDNATARQCDSATVRQCDSAIPNEPVHRLVWGCKRMHEAGSCRRHTTEDESQGSATVRYWLVPPE